MWPLRTASLSAVARARRTNSRWTAEWEWECEKGGGGRISARGGQEKEEVYSKEWIRIMDTELRDRESESESESESLSLSLTLSRSRFFVSHADGACG